MRCWIFSDLHRDIGMPWDPPAIPDADVAIVAGDVGQGLVESVGWLAATIRPHMRVVLVAGNHEFYRRTYTEELTLGRTAARNQGIDVLENDGVVIGGVAIHGCTLWTDYRLDGDALQKPSMEHARRGMNDHRLITWARQPQWMRFRPEEALDLHRASRAYLEGALAGPSAPGSPPPSRIVVSHHAPSARSVAAAFRDDPLNPAFASRLDGLIAESGPALWVHGHTHAAFDYRIGGTRVLCNPKGYHRENARFDPALVVDIPS
jgi:Icc-related predicted phosphoesterase